MGVILKNNANSTITTAISASDVGLAVATGTGSIFPVLGAGDYFYATLVSSGGTYEIVKVTARVGDTMTIVRAQEGTTAQSFASGSRIEVRVTAASITDMVDEHDQASEISLADAGGYYTSGNVEGALQEIGADFAGLDASIVSYTYPAVGAVGQTVQTRLEQYVSVKDFGAVGDGVTDDTAAIQAALSSGKKLIQGVPGETYLVSAAGTVTVNGVAFSYCLLLANGTTFDLNGSTVKQANAQNSSVIALNGLTDAKVINGTVDSNEANQTAPATVSMAGVLIHTLPPPSDRQNHRN